MPLFFLSPKNIHGSTAVLDPVESHHLVHVLRKRVGDEIESTDGRGNYFLGKIVKIDKKVELELSPQEASKREGGPKIILCQAIIKNPRMDWLIEKTTELGVNWIVPFSSERTVVKFKSEAQKIQKLKRWGAIARAAIKQSKQAHLPQIGPILPTPELLKRLKALQGTKILFIPEDTPAAFVKKIDAEFLGENNFDSIILLLGPEGGLTQKEIEELQKAGFKFYSLGLVTLRTETAAIAALAIVKFLTGHPPPVTRYESSEI